MEINLINPAHVNAIQNERWYLWEQEPSEVRDAHDIHGLLEKEHLLRKNTQLELYYRNRLTNWELLKEHTSTDKYACSKIIANYTQILVGLDWHYRLLEREWGEIMDSFVQGPLTEGINLWRSHPNWYMHKTLREDCAERGGCCGRSCGCCWHRETLLGHREHAAGHCTVNCDCCNKNRGCALSKIAMQRLDRRFDLSRNTAYFARIRDASLLGISKGGNENPFDLIEESESY